MYKTIFMSIFIHGCQPCSQDPSIRRHIVSFFDTYAEDDNNVCSASYGDPGDDNYGLAVTTPMIKCDIFIRQGLEPLTEKYVIYHEIGHCLGLDHVDNPNSIMYSSALDEQFYRDNVDLLEDELREQIEHNKY